MPSASPEIAEAPARTQRDRLAGLDGLRACAATLLLVEHTWLFQSGGGPVQLGPLNRYVLPNLHAGVVVFFALSGFLLYLPIAAAVLEGRARQPLGHYLRNRVLRIFPAYLLVLFAAAFVLRTAVLPPGSATGVGPLHDLHTLLLNALLIQNLDSGTIYTGVGPAWSLGVEAEFYLALPLLGILVAALARRSGSARGRLLSVLAAPLLLLVVGTVTKAALARTSFETSVFVPGTAAMADRSLPAMADLFAFGMLVAVARAEMLRRGTAIVRRTGSGLLLVAAAIGIVVMLPQVSEPIGRHLYNTLLGLAAGLLLANLALPRQAGAGTLMRALRRRPMVLVGTVSYGIFLWHEPLVFWLQRNGVGAHTRPGLVVSLAATIALTGLLSALTWRFVERPALARKARPSAVAHEVRGEPPFEPARAVS